MYFTIDAHPSNAPVNPDGTLGPVKEFPKPDGSEQAVGSVAATPDGAYLYVNEFQNSGSGLFYIAEFTIDRNTGDITHTTTIQVPNNGGLKVDPTGSVLAVAGYSNSLPENGTPKLSMYKIASDGSLTAVGDPISLFGTQVLDSQFDASGQHLFVLSNQAEPSYAGFIAASFSNRQHYGSSHASAIDSALHQCNRTAYCGLEVRVSQWGRHNWERYRWMVHSAGRNPGTHYWHTIWLGRQRERIGRLS